MNLTATQRLRDNQLDSTCKCMYGPWENAVHEWCASNRSGRILLSEFLKHMAHKQGYGGQTKDSEQDMKDSQKERKKEGEEPESTGGIHMCHMIPRIKLITLK